VTSARYDAVADFYEAGWPDSYDDEVSTTLFDLIGPLDGLAVLDLACGHGRMSRELARRGARVVGLDISSALLDKARATEENDPLAIDYRHGDAASPTTLEGEIFDAVVCSMALADVDDLEGAISTIARALNKGGCFVFSLLHPCFPGGEHVSGSWPATKRYYDEEWWSADGEASTLRRQVGANHRMLSTYVNALIRHGLTLQELREPRPPQGWERTNPEAAAHPVFVVARFVKT
jgi:SAM-dependent methyltransferase